MLVTGSHTHDTKTKLSRRASISHKKSSSAMSEKHSTAGQRRSWSPFFAKKPGSAISTDESSITPGNIRQAETEENRGKEAELSPSIPSPRPQPSAPVDVPSRPTSSDGSSRPSSRNGPSKRHQQPAKVLHDPRAINPATAAMLAMTTIPRRKKIPRSAPVKERSRTVSMDELFADWRVIEKEDNSLGSSPTMDVLLSAPDSEDSWSGSPGGESVLSHSLMSRSPSSDSVPSLDRSSYPMTTSNDSSIITPGRRRNNDGRVKPSPRSVEHGEHPLIRRIDSDSDDDDNGHSLSFTSSHDSSRRRTPQRKASHLELPKTNQPTSRRQSSSLKSNLTASLAAIRSAARSFSNFAAPAILPEDHLSRGLLNQTYRPEMRPRPIEGTPTPQMRRYLNPVHHLAPGDFHLHNAQIDNADLESLAAKAALGPQVTGNIDAADPDMHVIALQPFTKSGKPLYTTATNTSKQSRKSWKPISPAPSASLSTEAGRALLADTDLEDTMLRPRREPRDNCEFLRIAVLEMNMRRGGKMEGPVDMSGRRGWCLPPREVVESAIEDEADGSADREVTSSKSRTVPKRWVSLNAES